MTAELKDLGGGYFQVVIRIHEQCERCGKYIKPYGGLFDPNSKWSLAKTAAFFEWQEQATRKGSICGHDVGVVCVACKAKEPPEPKTFICDHCQQTRLLESELAREHDGLQYCTVCYATIPAKVWDALFYELDESNYLTDHEWD